MERKRWSFPHRRRRRRRGAAARRPSRSRASRRSRGCSTGSLDEATPLPGTAYKVEIASRARPARARRRRVASPPDAPRRPDPRSASLPLALAGCGGGGDSSGTTTRHAATTTTATTTTGSARDVACVDVDAPKPASARPTSRREAIDTSKTYEVTMETNCGSFTITLDQAQSPKAVAVVRLAREPGLLRRHRLPPDRAGLRDPGRRPDRDRHRRARLLDGRHAAGGRDRTRTAWSRWRSRGSSRAGTAGSQFFVVTADGRRAPARLRDHRQRRPKGLDVVDAIGQFGDPADPAGTATKVVVIEKATVTES